MLKREEAMILRRSNLALQNAFHSQAKQYWELLQEKEATLLYTYTSLINVCQMWPDQCKKLIFFLEKLSELLEQFYMLLEDFYPTPISTCHRSVIMLLQNILEHLKALVQIYNQMLFLYLNSPQKCNKCQQSIRDTFELLIKDYPKLLENIPLFLDQTRFPQSL